MPFAVRHPATRTWPNGALLNNGMAVPISTISVAGSESSAGSDRSRAAPVVSVRGNAKGEMSMASATERRATEAKILLHGNAYKRRKHFEGRSPFSPELTYPPPPPQS